MGYSIGDGDVFAGSDFAVRGAKSMPEFATEQLGRDHVSRLS
jgi:hypothetical protein